MHRARYRPVIAGLVLVGALAAAGFTVSSAAAQTVPLFPAGVVVVPVVGVAGVAVPPVVVTIPPLGVGTQRAHIEKERSHSRERADVTIGGD